MLMRNKHTGSILKIREFFITKGNLWEYYVIDDNEVDDEFQFCLVRGYEQELGDVFIPEVRPYIMTKIKVTKHNYHEIMPAMGYEWVE